MQYTLAPNTSVTRAHTYKYTFINAVKLWLVISSPLVTVECTIIVTHLEPRRIARDGQLTTRRADEETPGLLRDKRQFWQLHREVLGAFRRHNISSGGHVGRPVPLGNNGCGQLIAFLTQDSVVCRYYRCSQTRLEQPLLLKEFRKM